MSRPVVVVSGLGAPRLGAVLYGRALAARGLRTFAAPQRLLGYGDVRVAARLVAEEVERVRRVTSAPKVDLVGMSLGGLIGLYYLRCGGGAGNVERFVSVGGPLRGSDLARLADLVPWPTEHAVSQTSPSSELLREIDAAPHPEGVRMYSVGTHGDVLTPRSSWDREGLEPVHTPHGVFPLGHWMLFSHPGNLDAVARCLRED